MKTDPLTAETRITNSKPVPHIPLPFEEVIADVLKVKPPAKDKLSCECGCGEVPKGKNSRFMPGHDLRKAYKDQRG
jgi:hypothetical protein